MRGERRKMKKETHPRPNFGNLQIPIKTSIFDTDFCNMFVPTELIEVLKRNIYG